MDRASPPRQDRAGPAELERRHVVGAEREVDRGTVRRAANVREPEPAQAIGERAGRERTRQAHRREVQRLRQGGRGRHGAAWDPVEVGRRPVRRAPGQVEQRRRRDREARVEGHRVQERLQRRPRAARAAGRVEAVGSRARPADERPHGPGRVLDDDDGDPVRRPRARRDGLDRGLERRIDRRLARLRALPRVGRAVGPRRGADAERAGPRGRVLGVGQEPLLVHPVEHAIAARRRAHGIAGGGVAPGRGEHRDEQRRLFGPEVGRALAEPRLGRGLGAAQVAAERREVEVAREDLRLREPRLDLERAEGLHDLAREVARPRVGQPRELHRDRRGALHGGPGARVAPRGAQEGHAVDAAVGVEAAVLGGHERVREVAAGRRRREATSPRGVEPHVEDGAVGPAHDGRPRAPPSGRVGQRERTVEDVERDGAPPGRHERDDGRAPHQAQRPRPPGGRRSPHLTISTTAPPAVRAPTLGS